VKHLIHICDAVVTYLIQVTYFLYMLNSCDPFFVYVWRDSFICVTWLIHMCVVTHSYVWHNSFTCVWHDLGLWVTWLIHEWGKTHSQAPAYAWEPNSFRRIKRCSGWYHPRRHRLQRFRTATTRCACTPNAKSLSRRVDFKRTHGRKTLLLT